MMRLLFYIPRFKPLGGAEGQAIRICSTLAQAGYEVHVLTEVSEPVPGIHIHYGYFQAAQLAGQILPHLTIDWGLTLPADIHYLGGGIHAGYLRYYQQAYPSWIRWWIQWKHGGVKHRQIIARQKTLLVNPSAYFWANSQQTAQMAIDEGANPDHVVVRCDVIDTSRFNMEVRSHTRKEQRKKWGIKEDEIVFLFVAHNLKLKNFKLAAWLVRTLAKQYPVRLVLVGKHRPWWSAPWLIYAGYQSDMPNMYAIADIFIHPTWYDSCANVVLEAMASGLPVLSSNTNGSSEQISHGVNGFVLPVWGPPRDIQNQWYSVAEQLCQSQELREKIGNQAASDASQWTMRDYFQWLDNYIQYVRKKKVEREKLTEI